MDPTKRTKMDAMQTTPLLGRRIFVVATALFSLAIFAALAAVAPLSPAELKKRASHIVTGMVVGIDSKTQKSAIETAVGVHRDKVYTIEIKVEKVSKGAGIEVGDQIKVFAWRPSTRIPPLPGPQGHSSIPKKGDRATFHLRTDAEDQFTPLVPNGIQLIESES